MKRILVIQLLRLGDIILSAPALKSLRDRYPDCEIHLLFNSQFKNIKPLLPYVDKFIGFDRTKLQKRLKHRNVAYYNAFETVKKLVHHLKAQDYDQIVNLTHNRMSGYIAGAIDCEQTVGLKIRGKSTLGHDAFQFLNDHGLAQGQGLIHFSDLYLQGTGNVNSQRRIVLQETENGFSEIKKIVGHLDFQLAVQPLTSDLKKNWGLANFEKFIYYYHKFNPDHKIALIGAPSEKEELHTLYNNLKEMRVPVYLVICSLEGAFSLLRKTKVLVTGDTSIKHLAAGTHTRVVELSVGSSHLHFTGVYKKNSFILQAREHCAPCDHSRPCISSDHRCHSRLDPQFVSRVVSCIHARDAVSLNHLARKYSNHVEIYKTFIDYKFGWFAIPMTLSTSHVFDIILSFIRSSALQDRKPMDYIAGFLNNLDFVISDKEEWISRVVQLKVEIDKAKWPDNAFAMLNSSENNILTSLISFQVRRYGFTNIGQIENATVLSQIHADANQEYKILIEIIKTIFQVERVEQWTNKISNSLEIL